jgi:hypothetical protein
VENGQWNGKEGEGRFLPRSRFQEP